MSQFADFSNEFSSLLLLFKKTTLERKAFEEHVKKVVAAFQAIEQNIDRESEEEERLAIQCCIFDHDSQDMLENNN